MGERSVGGRTVGGAGARLRGRRPALAATLAGALGTAACGGGPPTVTVGSKFFTEQDILGELVATWIERTTDLEVERRLHLGGTFICHRALREGELDLYVEYTGTALTAILEREVEHDPSVVLEVVREAYRNRWGLVWTEPLGFENSFAILVRRETADSLGLETLSDLADHAGGLRIGVGYEFVAREDGLPGLRSAYGLDFRGEPVTMELGLLYRALEEGRVDVIAGNSTDGQIEALGLVQLRDDRRYFPPYDAVPVVRGAVLERHPGLRASLRRLGGRLDTEAMRRMNRAVDAGGRDFRRVAREWVERELGAADAPSPAVRRDPARPDRARRDRRGGPRSRPAPARRSR